MLPEPAPEPTKLRAVPRRNGDGANVGPVSLLELLVQGVPQKDLPTKVGADTLAADFGCKVETVHRMKNRGEIPLPTIHVGRRQLWATHVVVKLYREMGLLAG
jgi:hypothetical protein